MASCDRRNSAKEKLADAYDLIERRKAAARVRLCGRGPVGHNAAGEMTRSKAGVPSARIQRCRSRLCPSCVSETSRRHRRQIMERLEELHDRAALVGPLYRRPTDDDVASVRYELEGHAAFEAGDDDRAERCFEDLRAVNERRAEAPPRRAPKRPPRGGNDVAVLDLGNCSPPIGKQTGETLRRTRDSFRIGLPPTAHAYGCRFLTLTQPARADEPLVEALERLDDAMHRLTTSPVWRAHVDAAVIRYEFEWSTPETREAAAQAHDEAGRHQRAAELRARASFSSWWHVHVHALIFGRHWPHHARPRVPGPCPAACACAACAGVDDEDALLSVWRRALVTTGRYEDELRDRCGIDQAALLRAIRKHSHATRRTWAQPLADVKLGGAHIKIPSREVRGKRVTSWGALCEVVKYSTKPMKLTGLPVERVAEVIEAIDHRRLVRCTGLLFGLHLTDDESEGPKETLEGVDHETGIGHHALSPSGAVVDIDELVWVWTPQAEEARRRALEALWQFHQDRRVTGPPHEREAPS